jgi:hypothetical protein
MFADFCTCSHWQKFITLIFVLCNDCIEDMATFTVRVKMFPLKVSAKISTIILFIY